MQSLKTAAMLFDYNGVETIVTIIDNSDVYSVDSIVSIISHFIKNTHRVEDIALRCKRMRIIASMIDLCIKPRSSHKPISNLITLADSLGDSDSSKILTHAIGVQVHRVSDIGTSITKANIDLLRYYDMIKPQDVSLLIAALYISMRKNDAHMIVLLLKDICSDVCEYNCEQSETMYMVNEEINRRLIYFLYAKLNETKECQLLIS